MIVGGIEPIFMRIAPRDIAMAKFLFESYEGVGVVRTLDRKRATIVVLVAPDFAEVARAAIAWLREQIDCEVIPPPPDIEGERLLADLGGD